MLWIFGGIEAGTRDRRRAGLRKPGLKIADLKKPGLQNRRAGGPARCRSLAGSAETPQFAFSVLQSRLNTYKGLCFPQKAQMRVVYSSNCHEKFWPILWLSL